MNDYLVAGWLDPGHDDRHGLGVEAAWRDAMDALPPDAYIVSLTVDAYGGDMVAPLSYVVVAQCKRGHWLRRWNGYGSSPREALESLAKRVREFPDEHEPPR
jgi:hypothetical protein